MYSRAEHIRVLIAAILLAGVAPALYSSEIQEARVISALADKGFEGLRFSQDSTRVVYALENNVYRLQPAGISEALRTIRDEGGIDSSRECILVVTELGIPRVAMSLAPCTDPGESGIDGWEAANKGYDDAWKLVRQSPVSQSTFGDVDINVYPQLYLKNYIINQIYQVLFEMSPAVEVSLWKGAKFTAQVIFPVYNDGYEGEYMNIRPGYITLQQAFRLPFDGWGDVRLGVFDCQTYGAQCNVSFPLDETHWTVNGSFGYVGIGGFVNFSRFVYNGDYVPVWSVGPDYYWSRFNVQCQLRVARYLEREVAVRGDLLRHFKYCSVGLYLEKAFSNAIPANGGFRVYVSLPPYRYRRYKKFPRVDTGLSTGLSYNGNNERIYYYSPQTLADDTPIKRNSFNASYINSYLK